MIHTNVAEATRLLLRRVLTHASGGEREALLLLDDLFDEPARIAVAGMVNAGKSTLLNALVGERVAPTDAGECTRIPTWYRQGRHYEVHAVDRGGRRGSPLRFDRQDELVVDLAERDPDTVDHLLVACPSGRLGRQTLIDLPGHSSLSPDVARRAQEFLVVNDGAPVDGVVYLLRHRHPADLDFLEAFHGASGTRGAAGSVGVLSRADEAFGAGAGAMDDARLVSSILRDDPRLRGLCQDIVPVAGLLAESAANLRHDEVEVFRRVAALPDEHVVDAMSSVDAFRTSPSLTVTAQARVAVLERFGMFGLRAAVDIVRAQPSRSGDALSSDLLELSGIGELRIRLETLVVQRVNDLRARAVLARLAATEAVQTNPTALAEWERIEANAHGLRELDGITLLRRAKVSGIAASDAVELERLLGGSGVHARERLGAAPTADRDELHRRAIEQHARWAALRDAPLAQPITVELASMAVRTCEALLVSGAPDLDGDV